MPPRRSPGVLVALAGLLVVALIVGLGAVVLTGRTSPSASPTPSPLPSPTATPSASPSPTPSPTPTASPSPTATPAAACPMNGEPLADPALAQRPAIMAQIENNPIARPPAGLNFADLVIEAPVEGDTTRFMAVYLCREPVGVDVGPIRSLRLFNPDLYQQLRVVTFAFGAATWTLEAMNNAGVPYVNGLTGSWPFFYRGGPWAAPHNVFFDVDGARAELQGGSLTTLAEVAGPPRAPFAFDPAPSLPAGRPVSTIRLETASFWWFGWQWDAASGMWLRTDRDEPNFDRLTGERIQARTVVVQRVEQEVLPGQTDPGGYPSRRQFLTGEGDGVVYVGGEARDVRWSRPTADDVTTWTYADSGEPMVLPPGRIWWEIIPVGSAVTEG